MRNIKKQKPIPIKDMIKIGVVALVIYIVGAIILVFMDSDFNMAYYSVGGAFGMFAGFYMGITMMEIKTKEYNNGYSTR